MKIYIRTQNREGLLEICYFFINRDKYKKEINGYDEHDNIWNLGKYKSRKRALEVLDEIEDLIKKSDNVLIPQNFGYGMNGTIINYTPEKIEHFSREVLVYDMPKEQK